MRTTALLCLLMSACGGSDWDATVDDFAEAACAVQECINTDVTTCEADIRTDLDDARAELDATGEDQCLACLEVKAAQARAILDANCDLDAADDAAILAACDVDPAVDFGMDGVPDDDEACAGFP